MTNTVTNLTQGLAIAATLESTPSFAHQVVEFNQRVLNIAPRRIALLNQAEFDISVKSLTEEIEEFKEAYAEGDLIKSVDSIFDGMYFSIGVLYKMGLTPETINAGLTAVHEANMEKKLGVNARRGDGTAADAVKPEGWVPPEERIGAILDQQMSNS